MDYIKNDYELQQLARSIALEAIEEVKQHGGDHYELIDPQGEDEITECVHCGSYCTDTYCSIQCKKYDTE